ncbi:MAG: PEP-CTERM sorting domain-containing protein [Lentisphaeria bacterium]
MRHVQQLNWLGKLAVLGVLATGAAHAVALTVNSGDIAWNQDGNGTDVRIRYSALADGYYLNTDTSNAWVSTYAAGMTYTENDRRVDEGGGTAYLSRNTDLNTTYIWSVSLPEEIDHATIQNSSASWTWVSDDQLTRRETYITWYTSIDNGGSWQQYAQITAGQAGTLATDGGAVNNLTTALAGQTDFLVRAVLTGNGEWTPPLNAQIFRTGGGPYFGLDMMISLVPEPASLGLLALGGLVILRRRLK